MSPNFGVPSCTSIPVPPRGTQGCPHALSDTSAFQDDPISTDQWNGMDRDRDRDRALPRHAILQDVKHMMPISALEPLERGHLSKGGSGSLVCCQRHVGI